jgi:hypothetical protein
LVETAGAELGQLANDVVRHLNGQAAARRASRDNPRTMIVERWNADAKRR